MGGRDERSGGGDDPIEIRVRDVAEPLVGFVLGGSG